MEQYACPIIDGPKIWKPKTHRWSPICWEGLAKSIIDGREHPKMLHPLSVCWAHQYINSIPSKLPLPTELVRDAMDEAKTAVNKYIAINPHSL